MSVTDVPGTAAGFTPDPRVLVGAVPLRGYEHHAHERALAGFAPVHRTRLRTGLEVDVVTMGLADTRDLLAGTGRWPVLSNEATALRAAMRAQGLDPGDIVGPNPLYGDQQKHRMLHELVRCGSAGSRVDALRPRLRHLTLDLVDSLPVGEPVDLVETLAVPLPLTVMCELLGVPGELHADMRMWSTAIITDEPGISVPAGRAMAEVFGTLIRRRRLRPDDALLSALIHGDVGGSRLGDEQLITMLIVLVVAGHETVTSLIGNVLAALLHSPGAWKSLAGQDGAVGSAIAEVMRWDPPVRVTAPCLATAPIRLDQEHVIPEGSVVVVNLGAAGRCRRRNGSTADLFNPFRGTTAHDHVGFGHALHAWLGTLLAQAEVRSVIRLMSDRFPNCTPAEDIELTPRATSPISNAFARLYTDISP